MRNLIYAGLTIFFILFFWNDANAQLAKSSSSYPYANAVGARFTSGIGATYKMGIGDDGKYAEFFAVINPLYYIGTDMHFTALLEFHNDLNIEGLDDVRWYFGGGARVGSESFEGLYNGFHFGPVGIIGIEYTFEDIPLNVSLDFVPYFKIAFGDAQYFNRLSGRGSTGGLSARYIF